MRTAKAVSCGLVFVLSAKPDQALKIRRSGQTRPGKEANMDENMNQISEQEPETTDAFLDDWDGGAELTADQPEETAEPNSTLKMKKFPQAARTLISAFHPAVFHII